MRAAGMTSLSCHKSLQALAKIVASYFLRRTTEVLVPSVVKRDVRLIIVQQVELDRVISRAIEEDLVKRPIVRTNLFRVLRAVCVLKGVCHQGEQRTHGFLCFLITVSPEWLHRIEGAADTFHIRIA